MSKFESSALLLLLVQRPSDMAMSRMMPSSWRRIAAVAIGGIPQASRSTSSMASAVSKHGNPWREQLLRRQVGEGGPVVCRSPADMRQVRECMDSIAWGKLGRAPRVGFVPTMGALHSGHLQLMHAARDPITLNHVSTAPTVEPGAISDSKPEWTPADFVVASIFVNPTQFAPHEDLSSYPRTWEGDLAKCAANGVDVIFAPTASSMYPQPSARVSSAAASPLPSFRTFIDLCGIDECSPEGAARPGFFRGVATVVTKLLSCVQPTHAVFGQKDGIQCITVRTMVRDLNLPVHIHIAPTERADDGLALSSRNVYLSAPQRAVAPALFAALTHVRERINTSLQGKALLASAHSQRVAATRGVSDPTGSSAASDVAAERAAQAAAVRSRLSTGGGGGGGSGSASASIELDPFLATCIEEAKRIIADARPPTRDGSVPPPTDYFGDIQYLTFSDAATGAPIGSLSASTAQHGAVMLSVAARIGTTRLLDNIAVVGSIDDFGTMA